MQWLRCHEFGGDSVGKRFSSGKLCKSWRRVGERCLAVMSDYAAVEMEQDEEKGFRPEI
jgi:hypothetical protein